ncbi:MAG TPA: DeoR/GlpR family DNA-binding transcription regulator [Candidatus Limnocylindrales bacterium]
MGKSTRERHRTASLPEERRRAILELVDTQQLVRADDLAEQLGASVETVRRDLLALEQEGLTRRVYGGVTRPMTRATEPPFELRRATRLAAKRAMARLAASLVRTDAPVILDIGTSVAELARVLPTSFHGRVLTNSFLAAMQLTSRTDIELYVSGGRLRGGDLACYGPHAETLFEGFYGGIAFLGSGGVHPQIGLTDHHLGEVRSRQIMLNHADQAYVMADSSKLGQVAPVKVCDLAGLAGVITDDGVDPTVAQLLRDAGVELLIAQTLPSDSETEGSPMS